ncbi:MAG TPA: hypothetical protein VGI75_11530, partial [Pirellulales bacterium]
MKALGQNLPPVVAWTLPVAATLACVLGNSLAQEQRVNPLRPVANSAANNNGFAADRDKLCNQALAFAVREEWNSAIQSASQALKLQRIYLGADQPEAFGILESIAVWDDRAGDYRAATERWEELQHLSENVRGEKHWSTVSARVFSAECRRAAQLTQPEQQQLAEASRLSFKADQQLATGKYAEARDLATKSR